MTENNELTTVPSWLGAQCSGVSNPAGPTFVAIMVVLDGKASIELLSSGVLVTRTGIGVGADDDSEDNCVAQLPLEVRSTILGRVSKSTCVGDGLREEDRIKANTPGVWSDSDEEIDSSEDGVVGACRFREERGATERCLLVMMCE
jgi:hypothetical protein